MNDTDKNGIATCKIMDYKKWLYSQEKKAKANKKSKQDTKEIRLSDTIAENDMKTKAKHADKFIGNGDKVTIAVHYKGRQIIYIKNGFNILERFKGFMTSTYKITKEPRIDGNRVTMTLEAIKSK